MKKRLRKVLSELMRVPGLSGHEDRVRRAIAAKLTDIGIETRSDRAGNLIATLHGDSALPSVMLFAHMDQLGFVVRRIDPDGMIRLERLGGVPERALPSQAVLITPARGRTFPGVIANKSHHATRPDEKYQVVPYLDLYVDAGFSSAAAASDSGIEVGTPVVYLPAVLELDGDRLAGTSIDDRAGCAVLLEVAAVLAGESGLPTVHVVFSVQEEFNLRGAFIAAQALGPDIAIQLDLMQATDTPDMAGRGDMVLGAGPGMNLYSFHGRGTLNGVIPHPALVRLFEQAAAAKAIPLQRSAQVGALTDLSYVQLAGDGVAGIDIGFPMRYSHSSLEICDLNDLEQLARLLLAAVTGIDSSFSLDRDADA